MAYSLNGTQWFGVGSSNLFGSLTGGIGVCSGIFSSSTLSSNTLAYSTNNGTTWTGLGTSIFTIQGNGICYGNSLYISTGNGSPSLLERMVLTGINTLAYSSNGTQWTGLGTSIFTLIGNNVIWSSSNNRFVAVGVGLNTVAYSSNGTQWTGLGTTIFDYQGIGISWSGNYFVANGYGISTTMAYSMNGSTWTGIGTSFFSIVGNFTSSQIINNSDNTLAYSNTNNGTTWTGLGSSIFLQTNSIIYGNNLFIAVGTGSNSIAYSFNGTQWIGLGITVFGCGIDIAYNNNYSFVAARFK